VERLSNRPRQILGLPTPKMQVGEVADFTIFNLDKVWEFTQKDICSKSQNTPLIGKTLKGKVMGIVNNDTVFFNADETE
jgi:dihydroorotase